MRKGKAYAAWVIANIIGWVLGFSVIFFASTVDTYTRLPAVLYISITMALLFGIPGIAMLFPIEKIAGRVNRILGVGVWVFGGVLVTVALNLRRLDYSPIFSVFIVITAGLLIGIWQGMTIGKTVEGRFTIIYYPIVGAAIVYSVYSMFTTEVLLGMMGEILGILWLGFWVGLFYGLISGLPLLWGSWEGCDA